MTEPQAQIDMHADRYDSVDMRRIVSYANKECVCVYGIKQLSITSKKKIKNKGKSQYENLKKCNGIAFSALTVDIQFTKTALQDSLSKNYVFIVTNTWCKFQNLLCHDQPWVGCNQLQDNYVASYEFGFVDK